MTCRTALGSCFTVSGVKELLLPAAAAEPAPTRRSPSRVVNLATNKVPTIEEPSEAPIWRK